MTARIPTSRLRGFGPAALLLGLALACSPPAAEDAGPAAAEAPAAAPAGESPGDATPAARVGGEVITLGDVDAWIKDELFRRQSGDGEASKLHEMRTDALQSMIHQRLLEAEAARRGVSPEELLASEAAARAAVDEAEIRAFYDQNKDRIDAEYDEVAPRIRQHLERQAQGEATGAFLASLRDQAEVEILLETPRIDVAAVGPARGPEDAPVTIIEFSDYQCPFCRRAEPVVAQVLERYPEQVRFVYRHFPLDSIHPQARAAAEAAVCAEAQGRFWEFHEKVFAQETVEPEALEGYAKESGLDMEAFRACLEAPETKRRVETDLAAGRAAGVTGTPAFFVNGVPLRGARPVDDFVEIIERELSGDAG